MWGDEWIIMWGSTELHIFWNTEVVLAVNIQWNSLYPIFQTHEYPYDQANPPEVGLCMTDMFFVLLESIVMMKKVLVPLLECK